MDEDKDILETIRPTIEERLMSKLKRIKYCIALIWTVENFKKYGVVHAPELANYLRIDGSNALKILNSFVEFGLAKSNDLGNIMEFMPVLNDDKMKIEKYYPIAINRLKRTGIV